MIKFHKKISFTIAIPLYNEIEGLHQLKKKLSKLVNDFSESLELSIILVDDGSTDGTNSLLTELFENDIYKIITHENNLNLGGFINTSIKYCNSEYIGFLDSDCTYEPILLIQMLEKTTHGYDIINASPFHPDGSIEGLSKIRKLISYLANTTYRIIIRKNIYTSSSICKIYKTSLIKNIKLKQKGFVSITELFVKSLLIHNIKHFEFPCELSVRKFGKSKIKFISTVRDHIYLMVEVFFISLSGNKTRLE